MRLSNHRHDSGLSCALEEFMEDKEDYLLAVSRLEKKSSSISLKQLEKKLGLINKSKQRNRK